jgi:hypothetical protein
VLGFSAGVFFCAAVFGPPEPTATQVAVLALIISVALSMRKK